MEAYVQYIEAFIAEVVAFWVWAPDYIKGALLFGATIGAISSFVKWGTKEMKAGRKEKPCTAESDKKQ